MKPYESIFNELEQLSDLSNAVTWYGKRKISRILEPILSEQEKIVAVILADKSRWLNFRSRFRREFLILTQYRVIHYSKLQYFKPAIRTFFIANLTDIHVRECGGIFSRFLLGDNLLLGDSTTSINLRVYGDNVISAFGVAGKLLIMVVMIVIGYVTGYMPFAGYNYGARNTHRLIQAFKFTILSGTAACFAFLGLFLFCGPIFMRVFTSQQELIDLGLRIMHAQAWSIPLMAVQMTMMVTFQATGQAIKATIVNLGRQCLLYLPLLYLFNALWQLSGLMYAQCVADILTTVTAISLGIPFLKKLYMMDKSLQPAAAQT